MIHWLLAVFVVAHGAVHGIMFGLPLIPKAKADLATDGFVPHRLPDQIALAIAAWQAQTTAE